MKQAFERSIFLVFLTGVWFANPSNAKTSSASPLPSPPLQIHQPSESRPFRPPFLLGPAHGPCARSGGHPLLQPIEPARDIATFWPVADANSRQRMPQFYRLKGGVMN